MPSPAFLHHPYRNLTAAYAAWKALLLVIALGSCIGPAYDTSASLLLGIRDRGASSLAAIIATRLTSWDAIYFIQQAARGYVFEQEWAFGPGVPSAIRALRKGEHNFSV